MARNTNGTAPVAYSYEASLLDVYDDNGVVLSEEVILSGSGKYKSITQGNGDTIEIAPNTRGTLTDSGGDTFDFISTGTIRTSENEDGSQDITANGLNILGNPYLDPLEPNEGNLPGNYAFDNGGSYNLVQSRGHVTFTRVDSNGDGDFTGDDSYSPIDGSGQLLNVVHNLIDG